MIENDFSKKKPSLLAKKCLAATIARRMNACNCARPRPFVGAQMQQNILPSNYFSVKGSTLAKMIAGIPSMSSFEKALDENKCAAGCLKPLDTICLPVPTGQLIQVLLQHCSCSRLPHWLQNLLNACLVLASRPENYTSNCCRLTSFHQHCQTHPCS